MTHVAILVPQASVLVNSVLGLFKVFHLANQRSIQAGVSLSGQCELVGCAVRFVRRLTHEFVTISVPNLEIF